MRLKPPVIDETTIWSAPIPIVYILRPISLANSAAFRGCIAPAVLAPSVNKTST